MTKRFYMTRGRREEFRLTYMLIDGIKKAINDIEHEMITHLVYGRKLAYELDKALILSLENELKTHGQNGWAIDYADWFSSATERELEEEARTQAAEAGVRRP